MPTADPFSVEHLVAAALSGAGDPAGLARAGGRARTSRERQLVAIAIAYLHGEHDRVDGLAREHLVDHPDSVLVAAIVAADVRARRSPPTGPPQSELPRLESPRLEGNPS